jgi:hypothetical protein
LGLGSRLSALGALLCVASSAAAQQRLVEGRVTRPNADGRPTPVRNQWVVLHRVANSGGAPLDSTRTNAAGRYRIRYASAPGDADALFFVSARYGGIAYFTPPLRGARVSGGDADVLVYETSTDNSAIRWQGRHLVVSAPRGDRREIAEIFELENSGVRTIVAADSTSPVWHVALPAAAESATVAPGDVSAAAVSFQPGRAALFAPVSPGVRQIAITYLLPADAFPLSVPIERPVSVLEVLLEEPRAAVEGGKLTEVAPGVIDGRQFRRFLAQDVEASGVLRVTAPAPPAVDRNRNVMIVVGLVMASAMVGAVAISVRRKPRAESRKPRAEVDDLIAELAALDAKHERASPNDAGHASYQATRAKLKDAIERALAGPSGSP